MRGGDKRTGELFSYVDLEKRIRSDHPLRAIRGLARRWSRWSTNSLRFMRRLGGRRYRRRSCSERCCCRRSIQSGRNGS